MSSKRSAAAIARVVELFRARSAYWSSQGFHGASLYHQLAVDPLLPENLAPGVIAELEGVEPSAVSQRRKRGKGSSFLRTAANSVLYPTSAYCYFLAARFVERKPAPAALEYTRTEIST